MFGKNKKVEQLIRENERLLLDCKSLESRLKASHEDRCTVERRESQMREEHYHECGRLNSEVNRWKNQYKTAIHLLDEALGRGN